ncbi:MAG TPA: alpha/beta hydrolase [Amycolatopsis sp.]|uniref:alpha/beta hydrolase n=1 Tax=Amycolatopsis sp. TaxID=37632 RepID=UPI002B48F3FC|nr:alpha/beta hydrolase [Amycolatopsis sp.]HKS44964.1 alpha/beta hydrolase [Amycolatopsis sp.]
MPRAVQLLVSGFTYNHLYWDVPGFGDRYSYVAHATAAGYATFAVDPIGTGASSHPPGSQVTIDASAATLHQVIEALRAGRVSKRQFSQVIYVGHSLGSKTGWVEVSRYRDVDAFAQTASLHAFNSDTLTEFGGEVHSASDDPRFAALGLDPGYVTTKPGIRKIFYHLPTTDPEVLRFDEQHKDVGSQAESAGTRQLVAAPPEETVTRNIDVPVLSVVGQYDALDCGDPGGAACSDPQQVRNFEGRYYSAAARLTVAIVPDAGHDLNLHRNAPDTDQIVNRWIQSVLRPSKGKVS